MIYLVRVCSISMFLIRVIDIDMISRNKRVNKYVFFFISFEDKIKQNI